MKTQVSVPKAPEKAVVGVSLSHAGDSFPHAGDSHPNNGQFIDYKKISPILSQQQVNDLVLWKTRPSKRDMVGKLKPNSLHNILVHLRHDERYHGLFCYDRFAGRVVIQREPFWQSDEEFKIRKRADGDISYIEAEMDRDGLDASSSKVRQAIDVVSRENWINPPLDYFENIVWDKKPRLAKWLTYYLGAIGDEEYLAAVGTAWMVAGVARIYQPGCKAENMLVLEGEQGLQKSTALSVLANVGHGKDEESYFCDTLTFAKIQEKDTVLITQGKLIIEFAELARLGEREIEEVKGWMSIQTDEIRKPYGHDVEKFPRQFILAASTNEKKWLKDLTGNRRFWPVECGEIDIAALTHDREQLWAEAVALYKAKSIWWIEKKSAAWAKAEAEQDMRLLEDVWAAPIEQLLLGVNKTTISDILTSLKIDVGNQSKMHQMRVRGILQKLGFIQRRIRITGEVRKKERAWFREDYIGEMDL